MDGRRSWLRLTMIGAITAIGATGCSKSPPPLASGQPNKSSPAERLTPHKASRDDAPWRTARFCVRATELRAGTPPARTVATVHPDAALLAEALANVRELDSEVDLDKRAPTGKPRRAGDPACAARPVAAQVGVSVTLDYGATSPRGGLIRADRIAPGGRLYVSAAAHVERAGPNGKAELAESTVEATSPVGQLAVGGVERRVRAQLTAATTLAVRRALGQLWIRHQDDGAVRRALSDDDPWRRAAALQEIGERGQATDIAAVEEAVGDSRATVAVVACATLGRLAQARSVAVLRHALATGSAEVADAALYALHDIGTVAARAAVAGAATQHPSPWIRLRAKALLDAPGGRRHGELDGRKRARSTE